MVITTRHISHKEEPGISNIIPTILQIEPRNGTCTARCTMCTIDSWTREPVQMSIETYRTILEKFVPVREKIKEITLHGCCEPLQDRGIVGKVSIAKKLGFNESSVGFATNLTLLTEKLSHELINAGLDCIIFSIDGFTKETHESIRVRTKFEKVVENGKRFIRIRDQLKANTRIVVRFIRQEENKLEWNEYYSFWSDLVNPEKGDKVVKFDVHNWGDTLELYKDQDVNRGLKLDKLVCEDLFERLYIYANGDVSFCCADDNGFFPIGNVITEDPLELYNQSYYFKYYRQMMLEGRIECLEHCRTCTIPRSRALDRCN